VTPTTRRPNVLIVDDDDRDGLALADAIDAWATGVWVSPSEVTDARLAKADVVLVDYELERWRERDELKIRSLQPANGLALSAVLRAHLDNRPGTRPQAIALYTGQAARISPHLPEEIRRQVLARLHNVEWVFQKQDKNRASRIVSFANGVVAVSGFPISTEGDVESELFKLLRLTPKPRPFATRARADVLAAHPPVHEFSEATHALALIRWLAQRILPYPCFLLDSSHVARRLRVSVRTLSDFMTGTGRLARALEEARYTGVLDELVGRRWWRAAIDDIVFDLTDGKMSDDALYAAYKKASKASIRKAPSDPVVALSAAYNGSLASAGECVRIRPDDWPLYADIAWAKTAECNRDPRLRALVDPSDRGKLATNVIAQD
jgi:hypothetical protein